MSISRIPGDDHKSLEILGARGLSQISQDKQVRAPLHDAVPANEVDQDKRSFSHSVGLLAGLMVFALAMVVVVVALTCLAPGVPQSIVLAIALGGVSLGGFSVMKNIVNKVRDLFAPTMSEKQRIKSAAGIGIGFIGLGLAMKVGAHFIPGGYGGVVGNLGGAAYSKGSQSGFTSLAHYLYIKFARSEKAASGEPLTRIEIMQEAKKLHRISLSLLVVGVGFAALGITLAIVGTVVLGGVPATAMLVLAPPFISMGIGLVLQTLLHSSIGKWKSFLDSQKNQALFLDTGLKNIRDEDLRAHEIAKDPLNKIIKKEIDIEEETSTFVKTEKVVEDQRITAEEIDKRLSLTPGQKVIFALSVLLVLAGLAAVVTAGFVGMPALQVLLVATTGSSVASTVLPMASSGLVYNVFQCKTRLRIAKARWKEAKAKSQFKKQLIGGAGFSKTELNKAWVHVGKDTILETDRAIREEIANFEKGRGVNSVIVAGIFVVTGVGIMLLTLIPTLAPIMAGVLAIGSTLMIIGAAMYLQKFTAWLYNRLVMLRERLYSRRNYLSDISRKIDISTEDLIVDANLDDLDAVIDLDGDDDVFADAFDT
ncbi:putative inner membrane protein [Chlamydia abortus]|uniref:hypothetical protein n=1 Tax=Chlamydia abortus TaxID=83555 RepID=UPI000A27F49B|nr:hypothetical protein [Chlamydia abortus]SFZ99126.1 putative inner membrane protein [Chlamydia abortus]SGA02225.1 putative inner membrane protein [Chlamydia abortus]SGA03691.1 putative inner membrane protein [Chlamydia abortus]SGA13843.1 putative inner membrane protein [Chlamydia abortus]SGA20862.1 putative inner membrane protein [Chlamydia abortus]